MKKEFQRPTLETCEFVVAARLEGSGELDSTGNIGGGTGGHSNSWHSGCSRKASNSGDACAAAGTKNSQGGNKACKW